jgi:hypothetical protein
MPMALQWTPSWENIIIESHGVRLKVKRDKETGLLLCPICGEEKKAAYFFTAEDLIFHLLAHTKRLEKQTIMPRTRIEEQEEEYEEDEEE